MVITKMVDRSKTLFLRYVGIDYSGAKTPTSSLKGLRVYEGHLDASPIEVQPPPSPRKYWTRRGVARWLVECLATLKNCLFAQTLRYGENSNFARYPLSENVPTIVGIDHSFSFPLRYFESNSLEPKWQSFLDDFQKHWPTDEENIYVDFIRNGSCGNGDARIENTRWRRLTEERAGAKSVFHFLKNRILGIIAPEKSKQ